MSETVGLHLWRFSCLFVLGAGLEVAFEMYTAFRAVFRLPRPLRSFCDVLFSLLALLGLAAGLFVVNGGELRVYVVAGVGMGFGSCRSGVGPILSRLFLGLFRTGSAVMSGVYRNTALPVAKVVASLGASIRKLVSGMGSSPHE